jgi:phage FluMu gp28-like protein
MKERSQKDASEALRARVEKARATAGVALRDVPLEELEKRARNHKLGVNANGWVNPYPKDDPRSLLLEYQFAYREDKSRYKAAIMSRQSGKDFSSESEAAEDCLARPRTEWMIAAPSERQALDSLEQGKTWAEAFSLKIDDYQERREGGSDTLLKSAEIIFSNQSRMRAVPGKPDTVRGRSASLLLTEFDFFENPSATWRAILPSITNPLRGGEKRVRLITTPNGQGSGMHKIWTKPDTEKMRWSRHKVTIYHAVLMGLPVDIEELRQAFDDPDGWAQEFCCEFLDAASVLLPYELIATCESAEASEVAAVDYWAPGIRRQFPVDLGIDFGRKRDLTVCWAAEKVGPLQITKEVLCLEKTPTPKQVEILGPRIRAARRVCLDYSGPGIGLGDYLVQEFGEWAPERDLFGKVELVSMSNPMKVELFSKLRMAYERREWRIPVNTTIREDLHGIYRVVTPGGVVTYRAPHTEDGHSDRGTAQALCTRAGGQMTYAGMILVPSGRRAAILAGKRERGLAG